VIIFSQTAYARFERGQWVDQMRPYINIEIAGKEYVFLVDTGARHTRLHFHKLLEDAPDLFTKVGEETNRASFYRLERLTIGGVSFEDVSLLVGEKDQSYYPWQGTLGMDFFQDYAIAIDTIEGSIQIDKNPIKNQLLDSNLLIENLVPFFRDERTGLKWIVDIGQSKIGIGYFEFGKFDNPLLSFRGGKGYNSWNWEHISYFHFSVENTIPVGNDLLQYPIGSVVFPKPGERTPVFLDHWKVFDGVIDMLFFSNSKVKMDFKNQQILVQRGDTFHISETVNRSILFGYSKLAELVNDDYIIKVVGIFPDGPLDILGLELGDIVSNDRSLREQEEKILAGETKVLDFEVIRNGRPLRITGSVDLNWWQSLIEETH